MNHTLRLPNEKLEPYGASRLALGSKKELETTVQKESCNISMREAKKSDFQNKSNYQEKWLNQLIFSRQVAEYQKKIGENKYQNRFLMKLQQTNDLEGKGAKIPKKYDNLFLRLTKKLKYIRKKWVFTGFTRSSRKKIDLDFKTAKDQKFVNNVNFRFWLIVKVWDAPFWTKKIKLQRNFPNFSLFIQSGWLCSYTVNLERGRMQNISLTSRI